MCLHANFRSSLSSNSERSSTPMKGSRSSSEVVGVLDLVQISVHVAVEMAFDVALHDRLGVDEDAGKQFSAKAFADRSSVDEHACVVASRVGQARHVQHAVAERLPDIGLVLFGIVERDVARPDQRLGRVLGGAAEPAEVDVHARLLVVDGAAERLLLDADIGEGRRARGIWFRRSRPCPPCATCIWRRRSSPIRSGRSSAPRVRTLSHSVWGIVILIVITLSSA